MRTAVLGAGLAGLTAALELARGGAEVTVIEKNPYPGGLAATIREGDFCFDLGPHRFHTGNRDILRFVKELPGLELLELERLSRIRLLDRYFHYPLSLGNVLSTMPLHTGAGMLFSFMGEKVRSLFFPREQETFQGWVMSRFGRGLYEFYLAPYNRKLWGMEPCELSADWASQRITVPSLAGLVKETVFPSEERVRSLVSTFHYPRGGIGGIPHALAEQIRAAGGTILYGESPESITGEAGNWSIALKNSTLKAHWIVNTIPVNSYTSLLGDLLPDRVHEAAAGLRFRSLVFLTVLLNEKVKEKDHWIYTSEERYLFNRLSIAGNFDPDSPSQVIFEFSCDRGDRIWNSTREELLKSTIPQAEHLGLFREHMVTGSMLRREEHAYPVYDLSYSRNSEEVLDCLEEIPGSVSCGRQGLFRYNNMDHSIEMGRYAALEVMGEGSVREHFNWSRDTWADG